MANGKNKEKRYSLNELLDQCDPALPRTTAEKAWVNASPVGQEIMPSEPDEISAAIEAMRGFPKAQDVTPKKMQKWINAGRNRAVFNENIRLGHWKRENPLKNVRAFKIQERELSYLSQEQIISLLSQLATSKNKHVALISKVCLATGARWGGSRTIAHYPSA